MAVCSKCKHHQVRPKPELFSRAEMQSPAVLKAKLEWEQQQNERRQAEMQRFEAGQQFTYEPFNYPWCKAFTPLHTDLLLTVQDEVGKGLSLDEARAKLVAGMKEWQSVATKALAGDMDAAEQLGMAGAATVNPVTGEVAQVYALCARMNPQAQCVLFEQEKAGGVG